MVVERRWKEGRKWNKAGQKDDGRKRGGCRDDRLQLCTRSDPARTLPVVVSFTNVAPSSLSFVGTRLSLCCRNDFETGRSPESLDMSFDVLFIVQSKNFDEWCRYRGRMRRSACIRRYIHDLRIQLIVKMELALDWSSSAFLPKSPNEQVLVPQHVGPSTIRSTHTDRLQRPT